MKPQNIFLSAFVVLALIGCSPAAIGLLGTYSTGPAKAVDVTQLPPMRVVGLVVNVPDTLRVSEANSYKPRADIVWRGDPSGDRYEQVKAIFMDGIGRGASTLQGDLPVVIHIDVRKFHALTDKTRYSVGGVHAINFLLSVVNGRSGEMIVPPYMVHANLKAYGGYRALAAERLGQTQKVRITDHLSALIVQELTGVAAKTAE